MDLPGEDREDYGRQKMTFTRTFDYQAVRAIMTHPSIYPHIIDDFSPAAADFHVPADPRNWYVLVEDGGEVLGVWAFIPQSPICWEIHTCLLPCAWGRRAAIAAQELRPWLFENTPCLRVITTVPEENRLALRFAKRAGMTEYGWNEKSYLKGGELRDTILLGMSKE